jgi:hypothetical protein
MDGRISAWTAVALGTMACLSCSSAGSPVDRGGGNARATIDGSSYEVQGVVASFSFGEDGYFNVSGDPARNKEQDCVPGLSGGLNLYGSLPPTIDSVADLAGKRLAVEFSGDGDDANLCFVGTNGLLGAEQAWITFDAADGTHVTFSMSGDFTRYPEDGEEVSASASASGRARIEPLM